MTNYTLRQRLLASDLEWTHTFEAASDSMALAYAKAATRRLYLTHRHNKPMEVWRGDEVCLGTYRAYGKTCEVIIMERQGK